MFFGLLRKTSTATGLRVRSELDEMRCLANKLEFKQLFGRKVQANSPGFASQFQVVDCDLLNS